MALSVISSVGTGTAKITCPCAYCQSITGVANAASIPSGWTSNASAANGKKILSDAQVAAQLDRYNAKWTQAPVNGVTVITYSFYNTNPGSTLFSTEAPGYSAFTEAQKTAAREALSQWAAVSNVQFVEVSDPHSANIKFANTTSGPGQAWTYLPQSGDVSGTVWINPNQASNNGVGLNDGGYGMLTLIHEIGHALGLAHPGDYDASAGTPTYARDAQYYQDSWQYTVMSYFSETSTGANFQGKYASTVLQSDIAAIQALYGVRTNTRTGDTVYGFHSTAGDAAFDFTTNTKPVITIYDNGGNNTLDLSGFSTSNFVNLNQGTGSMSSVGGLTNNLSIANGTIIRTVIAGTGNDALIGNGYGDTLVGGIGNNFFQGAYGDDTMTGNGGTDTFNFVGIYGHDSVTQDSGSGKLTFDVAKSALSFSQTGNDLIITKSNGDTVTVKNYYTHASAFTFTATDGAFTPTLPVVTPPVVTPPVVTPPVVTPPTTTGPVRTGDTVYGFHSTAGDSQYDFTINTHPTVTIVDDGGYNTLDLSGYSTSNFVNLNTGAGSMSSVGGMSNNLMIANGTIIRTVIAGTGNDALIGNGYGDTLVGGIGNNFFQGAYGDDTMTGNGGTDTFNFYGIYGHDTVTQDSGSGKLTFDVAKSALSFSQTGNDLIITKSNGDTVTVKNYYTHASAFTFTATDGAFTPTLPVVTPPVVTPPVVTPPVVTPPVVTTPDPTPPTGDSHVLFAAYSYRGNYGAKTVTASAGVIAVITVDTTKSRITTARSGDNLVITKTGTSNIITVTDYYKNPNSYYVVALDGTMALASNAAVKNALDVSISNYNFFGSFGSKTVDESGNAAVIIDFDVTKSTLGFTRSGADLLVKELSNSKNTVLIKNYYNNVDNYFIGGTDGRATPPGSGITLASITGIGNSTASSTTSTNSNSTTDKNILAQA